MLNQLHLDRWAEVLVDHATNICEGSIVRINAQPSAERLLEAVYRRVLTAGGLPVVNCRPEFLSEAFYELANEEQLDWANPFARFEAERIDASINIGASNNLRALACLDGMEAHGALFDTLSTPICKRPSALNLTDSRQTRVGLRHVSLLFCRVPPVCPNKSLKFLTNKLLLRLRVMNRLKFILSIVILTASSLSYAAKIPMTEEKLKNEAAHIVIGKVLDVTTKVEKSEFAKGFKDTIHTITVEVQETAKGTGPKKGEKITVVAWTPGGDEPQIVEPKGKTTHHLRPPGPQGHEFIPKKGDTATFYLTGGGKAPYEPLLPNGIVRKKAE